jgi:hypothetical protein
VTVIDTPDGDNFVIQAPRTASSSEIVTMNGGLAQAQTQLYNVHFQDFVLYPVSRTDYSSQPDKQAKFRPSTFWFKRTNPPVVTFWNEPDNAAPYIMNIWVMQQPDDIVIEGGVGVDLVQRYNEAFSACLAAKLARKFPERLKEQNISVTELQGEASVSLLAALKEDIERTPIFISPGLWSYFR